MPSPTARCSVTRSTPANSRRQRSPSGRESMTSRTGTPLPAAGRPRRRPSHRASGRLPRRTAKRPVRVPAGTVAAGHRAWPRPRRGRRGRPAGLPPCREGRAPSGTGWAERGCEAIASRRAAPIIRMMDHRELLAPRRTPGQSRSLRRRAADPPPFHRLVYRIVRLVPRGKVVTYRQVAAILGRPRGARAVGTALGALRGSLLDVVPWQRVVSSTGRCSHRDGFWAGVQQDLLEREGVRFGRDGSVDLERTRWRGPRRGRSYSGP
jgi:methylated-DNA-protein-cysteine methyltransferase-like protein